MIRKAVLLLAVLSIASAAGCVAMTDASTSPDNPLIGEWQDTTGATIKFTEDVYYSSASNVSLPRFRYSIVGGDELRLTPIVVVNGVETVRNDRSHVESFAVDGDVLTMSSLWAAYYRLGSQALADAVAQAEPSSQGVQNTAEAQRQIDACGIIRRSYSMAFTVWFDEEYTDRTDMGYSVGQYMDYRDVSIEWSFAKTRKKLESLYGKAIEAYVEKSMTQEEAAHPAFVGWLQAAECPSGGEYKTSWETTSPLMPHINCSVHGD